MTHPIPPPATRRKGRHDERGEGVISAAIAVLVMAFLGVAMWIAFSGTLSTAVKHVNNQVSCVTGATGGGASNKSC